MIFLSSPLNRRGHERFKFNQIIIKSIAKQRQKEENIAISGVTILITAA